ncbi:MAG TPA: DUF1634 domain-containing protein [Elusimicrobiota bacterium]|jgi:uncharacterized membrane protein|nr:DUF1634 domain-containing protein [Elusimicrobiota bacterium]
MTPPARSEEVRLRGDLEIEDISSWVLRIGVVASVALMLLGLGLSFTRGFPSVERMQTVSFTTDFRALLLGLKAGEGLAFMELGILTLVLTPIMRVFGSMVLFAAVERDWFYTVVTFMVFVMTLLSLLVLR